MLRKALLKPIIVTLLVSGLTIGLNANAADVMTAPAHPGGKAIVAKTARGTQASFRTSGENGRAS